MEQYGVKWKNVKKMIWSKMEECEKNDIEQLGLKQTNIWNHTYGIIWNNLEYHGIKWNNME